MNRQPFYIAAIVAGMLVLIFPDLLRVAFALFLLVFGVLGLLKK